jgi:hypothetical protein
MKKPSDVIEYAEESMRFKFFDADGWIIGSGSRAMPMFLDWKGIDEKVVFFKYVGSMAMGTTHLLLESQGETKLVDGITGEMTRPMDASNYKEKMENVERYIEEECGRLGINRNTTRRNQ